MIVTELTAILTQALSTDFRKKVRKEIPAKRFGTPEEVADAAVFLATNDYANNCVLNLDGGLSAM
jgi:NAD(P)-dependent dehydrogenase (short-subunit alcohol dehydrogenase family)